MVLSDRTDNLLELRADLLEIKDRFSRTYHDQLLNFNGNVTDFFDFDSTITQIIEDSKYIIDELTFYKIKQIFNELKTFSSFVIDSALITQNGGIVLTTLDDRILSEITRLLEARYFTGKTEINELITLEDFGILCLHAVNTSLISVIQFKRECPFETALIISKKFSKRIKTTL